MKISKVINKDMREKSTISHISCFLHINNFKIQTFNIQQLNGALSTIERYKNKKNQQK